MLKLNLIYRREKTLADFNLAELNLAEANWFSKLAELLIR